MSKKRRKYKITNHIRFFLTLFLLTTIAVVSILFVVVDAKDTSDIRLVPIYIEKGDTLWNLSEKYAGEQVDVRKYIAMVMEINHLKLTDIKPGKLVYFPEIQ